MPDELYIKCIELVDSKKVLMRSKWIQNDRVDIQIFVKEMSTVFVGSSSEDAIRKKQELGIKYEAIKDSLTSGQNLENISYELDFKKLKFSVVSQTKFDSDSSFAEIIFLKFGLTKLKATEIAKLTMILVDDMFEYQQRAKIVESENEKYKRDLKEMLDRFKKLTEVKMEFDMTTLQDVTSIINAKKKRISELELKLQKSIVNTSNKFANISSDLDQSDILFQVGVVTTKSVKTLPKPFFVSQSTDDDMESPKPSTSKISSSPSRRRVASRTNTPKSIKKRRSPKKQSQSPNKSLFQFKGFQDSDKSSDDLLFNPLRKLKSSEAKADQVTSTSTAESVFANMNIKVTPKNDSFHELNPSSVELFIPKASSRRRLISSSSDKSHKSHEGVSTPELIELAQKFDCDSQSQKTLNGDFKKIEETQNNSEDIFCSDNETLRTQQHVEPSIDDEVVENSQPFDSPSIFDTYAKRKLHQTPQKSSKRTKLEATRSKFSEETVDILA